MDIEDIILNIYNFFRNVVSVLVCLLPFYLLYALIDLRRSRKGMGIKNIDEKISDEKTETEEKYDIDSTD